MGSISATAHSRVQSYSTMNAGVSVILAGVATLLSMGFLPETLPFSSWLSFFAQVAILFPVGLAFDTIEFENEAESFGEKLGRFRIVFFRALIFSCLATVMVPLVSHFIWQFPPDEGRFIIVFVTYSILVHGANTRLFLEANRDSEPDTLENPNEEQATSPTSDS